MRAVSRRPGEVIQRPQAFEPCDWGHILRSVETRRPPPRRRPAPPSFNGATLRGAWGRDQCQAARVPFFFASMGPRFGERGDAASPPSTTNSPTSLQWGHALGSVETHAAHRRCLQSPLASMGPRFGERGDAIREWIAASNLGLQWGHAPGSVGTTEAALTRALGYAGFNGATLRGAWGRRCRSPMGAREGRFNGATLRGAWGPGSTPSHPRSPGSLQWGHAPGSVGTIVVGEVIVAGEGASMGPRSGERGD